MAFGTSASVASVTVPVSVPVRICAGAKLIAISTIRARKKAESRLVVKLCLELTHVTIVLPPKKYAERLGIEIGYSMIAPASRGYSSNFVKSLLLV
jgi:hypothetical protein